uniref:Protein zwilch n=1 Tax=Periophthalmus magnuspinnatus TaxID=409849 RepID=A0A3B4A4M2_9GOBI
MFFIQVLKIDCESEPQATAETSNCSEIGDDGETEAEQRDESLRTEPDPQPLSVNQARQLLSFYTLAQNPSISLVTERLAPLWVRCDMSDPAGTAWLGAEMVYTGSKVTGAKLYSVTCKGPTVDHSRVMTLDEVKQEHRKKHHSPSMTLKGSARYNLFGSVTVENTIIDSQSSVTVDFKWSDVARILETPPMSSTATLFGCDLQTFYSEFFFSFVFHKSLADGLRTGEIEWVEPIETTPAVDLTRALLEGDCVTSCQDIGNSLKLVIDGLRYGEIKPWVHRDSNSSLSKLILQSYHQKIDPVCLTGLTPVQMLLEMGLDKMRKDYINYLIGKTTTSTLTEVNIQEQISRLEKLHHLLEILGTCTTFLGLPYHRLFLLTQSCLQHYKTNPYDGNHTFKLPVQPALITHFYQTEHPVLWGVEVCSGHGPREVRTLLQLSDQPLVDHVVFDTDYGNETVNGDSEELACFSTLVCCSLVNFV